MNFEEGVFLRKEDLIVGFSFFFLFLFFRFSSSFFEPVFPNFGLVLILSFSFFINRFWSFIFFLILSLIVNKFLPFLVWEYLFLLISGILSFIFFRFFFSSKNIFVFLSSLIFWQIIFYLFFSSDWKIFFSFIFLREFIYNALMASLMFVSGLWAKKKFI